MRYPILVVAGQRFSGRVCCTKHCRPRSGKCRPRRQGSTSGRPDPGSPPRCCWIRCSFLVLYCHKSALFVVLYFQIKRVSVNLLWNVISCVISRMNLTSLFVLKIKHRTMRNCASLESPPSTQCCLLGRKQLAWWLILAGNHSEQWDLGCSPGNAFVFLVLVKSLGWNRINCMQVRPVQPEVKICVFSGVCFISSRHTHTHTHPSPK